MLVPVENRSFFVGDKEDIYCAGAGFHKAPRVPILTDGCVAPKSYKEGRTGGKGVRVNGDVVEGGFGGGGGYCHRKVHGKSKYYFGAGGGFTGGSTKVVGPFCYGGGGGSFSADPNAKFDHEYVKYGYCQIMFYISAMNKFLSPKYTDLSILNIKFCRRLMLKIKK